MTAQQLERLNFMTLVRMVYTHPSNFQYDNQTKILKQINYTQKELKAMSKKEVIQIAVKYKGEQ